MADSVLFFVIPNRAESAMLVCHRTIVRSLIALLATIVAALVAVLVMALTALPLQPGLFLFGCATASLVIYAHRSNIVRMLNGTESRFSRPLVSRLFGGK